MENMEFEVLDAFEHTLKSNLLKELPSYELVYREVMCQQGSADFVCFPMAEVFLLGENLWTTFPRVLVLDEVRELTV